MLFLLPHQTLTFPARPLSVTEVRWVSGCVVHAHLLVPVLSGEVLIKVEVCRCPCTFYGMCSSLVLHRFPILRDVGSCRSPLRRMFELLFVCASLVCHGRSSFLERIACCAESKHKEVFLSTRTRADLNTPRDEAIKFPTLCTSTVSFRLATGLVLSFNVSGCDDYSHMLDAFGKRFSAWLFSLSRLSKRVSVAGVERDCCCCGLCESVFRQEVSVVTVNVLSSTQGCAKR